MKTTFLIYGMFLLLLSGCAAQNPLKSNECIEGDCHTGSGIIIYHTGARYEGEFLVGKRHGHGIYTLANGAQYAGDWKYNSLYGQGTITFPDGAQYIGMIKNGKPQGRGVFIETDGSRVEGRFRNHEFLPDDKSLVVKERERLAVIPGSSDEYSSKEEIITSMPAQKTLVVQTIPTESVSQNLFPQTENVENYCSEVSGANGGSFQVEEACLKMSKKTNELDALESLKKLTIPQRIQKFCKSVADNKNGSFSTLLSCVNDELAAQQRLK